MYSSECGEYWRILLPGDHKVRAVGSDGFSSDWISVTVPELSTQAMRVDFVLNMADASANRVDYVPSLRGGVGTNTKRQIQVPVRLVSIKF